MKIAFVLGVTLLVIGFPTMAQSLIYKTATWSGIGTGTITFFKGVPNIASTDYTWVSGAYYQKNGVFSRSSISIQGVVVDTDNRYFFSYGTFSINSCSQMITAQSTCTATGTFRHNGVPMASTLSFTVKNGISDFTVRRNSDNAALFDMTDPTKYKFYILMR